MTIWGTLRSKLGIDGPRLPPLWVHAADTSDHLDHLDRVWQTFDDVVDGASTPGEVEIEVRCVVLADPPERVVVRHGDATVGALRDDYAREYATVIARAGGEVTVPGLLYLDDDSDGGAIQLLIDLPDPEDLT